ncbi:PH domain-containing protein [Yeosuana sp. MJ-SS3]|uniref:PH domain-containing protein n=1 Tax=Gilvirhabdus luticola TaxID=3079858 RepID=A0ABU3U9Q3_9FLAO|nr:PH domain-containing protein [Yeosuana sp. MJ-SS3]MDU8887137.1 PH domain-containing protein [Yeosuana sp. MJ-SS3]
MSQENNLIIQAEFNPKIKRYILFYVAFFFFISVMGIPLLLFWFLGIGQTLSKRYYEHLDCRLTEKHLEFRKGYLFKVEKTIPLENIQDLTFIENPLLKYFDLRILKIETAGQSNMKGSDMKLVGIIDALKFKKQVLDQREKLTRRSYTTTTENSSQQTNILLEEIKDLLTDIRDKS